MSKLKSNSLTWEVGDYEITENYLRKEKEARVSILKDGKHIIGCSIPTSSGVMTDRWDGYDFFDCVELDEKQMCDLLRNVASTIEEQESPTSLTFDALEYYLNEYINYSSDDVINLFNEIYQMQKDAVLKKMSERKINYDASQCFSDVPNKKNLSYYL